MRSLGWVWVCQASMEARLQGLSASKFECRLCAAYACSHVMHIQLEAFVVGMTSCR